MNSRPVRPGVSAIGRVDRRQRQGHGDDREDDLARADQRRLERRLALLDVAVDVLQHDDGVVDDQADRQHQGQQRQRVDREAERRTSARRSRSARPGWSPPGSAWRGTSAGTAGSPGRRGPRPRRWSTNTAAIERSMNTVVSLAITASMPAGRFSTRLRQRRADGAGDVERVGGRLLDDADGDRVLAVEAGGAAVVLGADLDLGDIAQRHREAVRVLDHDRLELPRAWSGRCAASTVNSRSTLSMRPAGTSRFWRRIASSTSWTVRP